MIRQTTFAFLFILASFVNSYSQVYCGITIGNLHSIDSSYYFDVFLHTADSSVSNLMLGTGDIWLDFDDQLFSNYSFSKVPNPNPPLFLGFPIESGFCSFVSTNHTDTTDVPVLVNVRKWYYDNTAVATFTNGFVVINLNTMVVADSAGLYDRIANIDQDTLGNRLGRFKIDGYLGGNPNLRIRQCLNQSPESTLFTYIDDGNLLLEEAYSCNNQNGNGLPSIPVTPIDTTTNPPIDTTTTLPIDTIVYTLPDA